MPVNSTPNNISYVSAGVPRGASPMGALIQDMRKATNVCFGGKLFLSTNYHGQPLICHAISSGRRDVVQELSKFYSSLRALPTVPFLTYSGSNDLGGGQVVFTFALGENFHSMRQIMNSEGHEKIGMQLFPKLVDILTKYYGKTAKYKDALCCISLDTVFMTPQGECLLLPLQCPNQDYPRGFPLEVGTDEADERTDLYTAALLTLQVISGCEYESRAEKKCMRPDMVPEYVKDCLCVFPSGRKNLAQTRNLIALEAQEAARVRTSKEAAKPGRRSKQVNGYDAAGNPIYDNGTPEEFKSAFSLRKPKAAPPIPDDEEEFDAPIPAGSKLNAIFAPLRNLRHIWAAPEEEISGTADYPTSPVNASPYTYHQPKKIHDLGEDAFDYFSSTRFGAGSDGAHTSQYIPDSSRQSSDPNSRESTYDCIILTDDDDD